ncbi:hypothetical protein NEISUBOT_05477 [Neisseria subflava NJ9703]|uniref:Uncharacterized protein n=1 Tax=Neisseria subflava NJ9703 TaxID=546268 RepID=A0A9W5MYE9_NEISU|nr:hypothetical protein NEISUBOT_05477 [Neisseria subflava NJ9703]
MQNQTDNACKRTADGEKLKPWQENSQNQTHGLSLMNRKGISDGLKAKGRLKKRIIQ